MTPLSDQITWAQRNAKFWREHARKALQFAREWKQEGNPVRTQQWIADAKTCRKESRWRKEIVHTLSAINNRQNTVALTE